MFKTGPKWLKHYISGNHFCSKMPESSGYIYSFISMLENIWYHHFTWSGQNPQNIVNRFQFSLWSLGSWNSNKIPIETIGIRNWSKTQISYELGLFHLKSWFHIFSNMKKEEYMEFECSVIFRVKVVVKNIMPGSLFLQCDISLWWNMQFF